MVCADGGLCFGHEKDLSFSSHLSFGLVLSQKVKVWRAVCVLFTPTVGHAAVAIFCAKPSGLKQKRTEWFQVFNCNGLPMQREVAQLDKKNVASKFTTNSSPANADNCLFPMQQEAECGIHGQQITNPANVQF